MSDLRNLLQHSHADLTQWFLLHQECLLVGDDDSAESSLLAFTDYLEQHIQFENSVVLTAMESVEECLRWKIHLYRKEHDKIKKLLEKIAARLSQYYQYQGRRKRLALLQILDDEQTLKHVLEHHEVREEEDLFLHLDRVLDQQASSQWVVINDQLLAQYKVLKKQLKQMLEE